MFYHFRLDHRPDYHLSKNGKYKSHIANHAVAERAMKKIRPVLKNAPQFPEGPINVQWIVFLAKGQRAMDDDNLLGAFWPYQDEIARAIGVNDSHFTPTVEQHRDRSDKGFTLCLLSTKEEET